MELGCIGFLIGAITAIIMIGIGVCFGRIDKRAYDNNNSDDIRIYVPGRNRRSVGRYFTPQEKIAVLNLIRMDYRATLTRHESEILEAIIDDYKKEVERNEMDDRREEASQN